MQEHRLVYYPEDRLSPDVFDSQPEETKYDWRHRLYLVSRGHSTTQRLQTTQHPRAKKSRDGLARLNKTFTYTSPSLPPREKPDKIHFETSFVWNNSLISRQQSSATLMHSTCPVTFPKSQRFTSNKKESLQPTAANLTLPSTLRERSCSLGKGERSRVENLQGMEAPPPTKYNATPIKSQQGVVFGLSHTYYRKVYQDSSPQKLDTDKTPGPGEYNVVQPPGKNKKMMSILGRIEPKARKSSLDPSYKIADDIVRNQRYWGITFGIGGRANLANMNQVPGPGSYISTLEPHSHRRASFTFSRGKKLV